MKYIRISKQDGSRDNISREEALEIVGKNYRSPAYVLQEAEKLFGNRIGCTFSTIEIREDKKTTPGKE